MISPHVLLSYSTRFLIHTLTHSLSNLQSPTRFHYIPSNHTLSIPFLSSMSSADSDELPPVMGAAVSCVSNTDSTHPTNSNKPAHIDTQQINAQQQQQQPTIAPVPVLASSHPALTLHTSSSSNSIPASSNTTVNPPLASPKTHPVRPSPVVVATKCVKQRTEAGAKMINGRLVMQPLGEGATAEVSLCQDPQTGEYYVRLINDTALTYTSSYIGRCHR